MFEGLVRVKSKRACHKHLYGKIGEVFGFTQNELSGSVRYGVSFYGKDYEVYQCELEQVSYRDYLKALDSLAVHDASFIDRIELWSCEEYSIEDDHINFYIPIVFDPYQAFGVYKDSEENDDYINVYVDWYPEDGKAEMTFCYVGDDIDFCLDVQLSEAEKEKLYQKICDECETAYGYSPSDLWNKYHANNTWKCKSHSSTTYRGRGILHSRDDEETNNE